MRLKILKCTEKSQKHEDLHFFLNLTTNYSYKYDKYKPNLTVHWFSLGILKLKDYGHEK